MEVGCWEQNQKMRSDSWDRTSIVKRHTVQKSKVFEVDFDGDD